MRFMGATITRVKSTKLDSWAIDMIKIMQNVNNEVCNEFWECNLINENYKKPNQNSSLEELKKFAHDKYVKKLFSPKGIIDPVSKFKITLKNNNDNKDR